MSNVSRSATTPTTRRGGFSDRLAQLQLGRYSGVFILIALIAIFSVWLPNTFLTDATWKTIAQGQAITAILAVSLLFPLAAGGFDLSAAQIMGFCALICADIDHQGTVSWYPGGHWHLDPAGRNHRRIEWLPGDYAETR